MKKIIIGLSGLVVLAFAVVLFTNAQASKQEVKKAATEVSKDCGKCPSASTCPEAAKTKVAGPNAGEAKIEGSKAGACDMAKCKAAGCDMTKCKEGKCDPATCKAKCAEAKSEMKGCDPAKCTMKPAVK
jgi:hypothetical protein